MRAQHTLRIRGSHYGGKDGFLIFGTLHGKKISMVCDTFEIASRIRWRVEHGVAVLRSDFKEWRPTWDRAVVEASLVQWLKEAG